jgi:hypothetical protein
LWWRVVAVVVVNLAALVVRVVLELAQDFLLPLELITPLPLVAEARLAELEQMAGKVTILFLAPLLARAAV